MIDDSEKRNRQLAFELENSHVCEERSKPEFFCLLWIILHRAMFPS